VKTKKLLRKLLTEVRLVKVGPSGPPGPMGMMGPPCDAQQFDALMHEWAEANDDELKMTLNAFLKGWLLANSDVLWIAMEEARKYHHAQG